MKRPKMPEIICQDCHQSIPVALGYGDICPHCKGEVGYDMLADLANEYHLNPCYETASLMSQRLAEIKAEWDKRADSILAHAGQVY